MSTNTKKNHVTTLLVSALLLMFVTTCGPGSKSSQEVNGPDQYVCLPCGNDCDDIVANKPGTCSHCHMELVKKSSVVFNTIQPESICSYIAGRPDVLLLDVRTKEEFDGTSFPDYGTLKNAINIPIQELATRLNELAAYKNKAIIVYCSHSKRSPQASYMLTQNGFNAITNMAGGLSELEDDSCRQ